MFASIDFTWLTVAILGNPCVTNYVTLQSNGIGYAWVIEDGLQSIGIGHIWVFKYGLQSNGMGHTWIIEDGY